MSEFDRGEVQFFQSARTFYLYYTRSFLKFSKFLDIFGLM